MHRERETLEARNRAAEERDRLVEHGPRAALPSALPADDPDGQVQLRELVALADAAEDLRRLVDQVARFVPLARLRGTEAEQPQRAGLLDLVAEPARDRERALAAPASVIELAHAEL